MWRLYTTSGFKNDTSAIFTIIMHLFQYIMVGDLNRRLPGVLTKSVRLQGNLQRKPEGHLSCLMSVNQSYPFHFRSRAFLGKTIFCPEKLNKFDYHVISCCNHHNYSTLSCGIFRYCNTFTRKLACVTYYFIPL